MTVTDDIVLRGGLRKAESYTIKEQQKIKHHGIVELEAMVEDLPPQLTASMLPTEHLWMEDLSRETGNRTELGSFPTIQMLLRPPCG